MKSAWSLDEIVRQAELYEDGAHALRSWAKGSLPPTLAWAVCDLKLIHPFTLKKFISIECRKSTQIFFNGSVWNVRLGTVGGAFYKTFYDFIANIALYYISEFNCAYCNNFFSTREVAIAAHCLMATGALLCIGCHDNDRPSPLVDLHRKLFGNL